MIRTAVITFIVAACLVLGNGHASTAAGEEPARIAPSPGNEISPDKKYFAASSPNDSYREGRLVYFVDGAYFDEVAELPADEENITWGVVYDDPVENNFSRNYFFRVLNSR